MYVCTTCGFIATKVTGRNVWQCLLCEKKQEEYSVSKVQTPYSFKLLVQELAAISIMARIKTR